MIITSYEAYNFYTIMSVTEIVRNNQNTKDLLERMVESHDWQWIKGDEIRLLIDYVWNVLRNPGNTQNLLDLSQRMMDDADPDLAKNSNNTDNDYLAFCTVAKRIHDFVHDDLPGFLERSEPFLQKGVKNKLPGSPEQFVNLKVQKTVAMRNGEPISALMKISA